VPAADESLLDNPVWHALQGPNRAFARTEGRAARFDPEVASFAALPDDADAHGWRDLATLYRPDEPVVVAATAGPPPQSWTVVARIPAVQMVGARASPARTVDPTWIGSPLGAADVGDMLELVDRTKPGPFRPRTVELGGYLGVRRDGRLVAMAGRRLHVPGFAEVSAVCTDVELRGRGIGGSLVDQVVAGIVATGDRPFLHATATNISAIRLYESLGFAVRTELDFLILRIPTGATNCE
jgi:ribosomal protein S18 acetylase RimI-like enzyme